MAWWRSNVECKGEVEVAVRTETETKPLESAVSLLNNPLGDEHSIGTCALCSELRSVQASLLVLSVEQLGLPTKSCCFPTATDSTYVSQYHCLYHTSYHHYQPQPTVYCTGTVRKPQVSLSLSATRAEVPDSGCFTTLEAMSRDNNRLKRIVFQRQRIKKTSSLVHHGIMSINFMPMDRVPKTV